MRMLYIGTAKVELPKGSWLFIGEKCDHPRVRVFDPLDSGSFNPLKNIDKKTVLQIAKIPYLASPEGANTLTVRNGRRALAPALFEAGRFDKVAVQSNIKGVKEEVQGVLDDLLFTDVMRSALCSEAEFGFDGTIGLCADRSRGTRRRGRSDPWTIFNAALQRTDHR